MLAVPLASAIGGPLSTVLLGVSLFGLAGWQTMFIVEGLPAVILGVVVLWMLPDRPASARWLNDREKRCLQALVARDEPAPARLIDGLLSPRVWLFSAIYFGLVLGLYGFGFWAPQIIKSLGRLTNVQVGLISAIPYLVSAAAMVLWGRRSDLAGERMWHCSVSPADGAHDFVRPQASGHLSFDYFQFFQIAPNPASQSLWFRVGRSRVMISSDRLLRDAHSALRVSSRSRED